MRTNWAKIQAYWQAAGVQVDDETRSRVRTKLAHIEISGEHVSHAAA